MANLASHFTDALVFIYDANYNFIAKTIVIGHDRDEMYIEVKDGLDSVKPRTRLHLRIIHSAGASELKGIFKCARQGIYEISIYGEKQRDVRASTRLRLNASAVISDMITASEIDIPGSHLPVTIENISTTGILIRSNGKRFEMESLLQVEFNLRGKNVIVYGEVVREQAHDAETYKYGCQLKFLD